MAVLYIHQEEHEPFHTIKLEAGPGAAVTAEQALRIFSESYVTVANAYPLDVDAVHLQAPDGWSIAPSWIIPCGLPHESDVFVRSGAPAATAHNRPSGTLAAARGQEGVSAIAASQAKMGEISYYYSVNKNVGNTVAPQGPQVPKARFPVLAPPQQRTISSYSIIDDTGKVKVNIPLAGAKQLPSNAVIVTFYERSFTLTVQQEESLELSLNIPLLQEEIQQNSSTVRVLEGRLLLTLMKRDSDKVWFELRKTKGVGDAEYDKLVPWTGEPARVQCGGSGRPLPENAVQAPIADELGTP